MASIFMLNDTRIDRHHGCSIVMRNLIQGLEVRGATIAGTLGCGRRLEKNPQAVSAFSQAERIVINGEGTLHHDRPYARYLLETAATAVAAGKKVYLLNASWEDNSPAMAALLKGFAGIWVRDSGSASELQRHGVLANVVPDLTFLSRYAPVLAGKGDILVTDSVFAETSQRLQKFAQKSHSRYLPIIQAPAFSGERGAFQKWLKFHVYTMLRVLSMGVYRPRQYYVDLRYCESDTAKFLLSLAEARALVAGRYHAVCLALQHALPLVCLASNTRKVQSLLYDAGIDAARHMSSLATLESSQSDAVLANAAYTAQEQLSLQFFLESARERINAMLDAVMCDD